MRINKKLYFNYVFYIFGTCLLIIMSGVILTNFFRDGKIFAKSGSAVVQQPIVQQQGTTQVADENGVTKNFVYKKSNEPSKKPSNSSPNDSKKTPENTPTPSPSTVSTQRTSTVEKSPVPSTKDNTGDKENNVIFIDVLNYTGNASLAKEIKSKLEAKGYVVNVIPQQADLTVNTTIIEQTSKVSGQEIRSTIMGGFVQKDHSTISQADATVIIGADMLP